jgi:uncharacterized protein (DUF924 family)
MTAMTPITHDWIADILQFWFREIPREAWFGKDEAFDRQLHERFLAWYEHVAVLPIAECVRDRENALAAVIALDQFPRNMFRGTPRAFATEAKAREIVDCAIASGFDAALSKDQRTFLYLPYQHAEDAAAQVWSVELVASLEDAELTRWAVAHMDIIDRFGRFPHRNVILGRTSTPEEIAFLAQPGSSF